MAVSSMAMPHLDVPPIAMPLNGPTCPQWLHPPWACPHGHVPYSLAVLPPLAMLYAFIFQCYTILSGFQWYLQI